MDEEQKKQGDTSSYRQILKATSIFGGVQVFQILIQVIRSKFVAVLLGPTGMGISGLFLSTLTIIGSLTNFGLGTSAVKNVSEAKSEGSEERIAFVVIVFRRLVWLTGLLGCFVTIIFASYLSELTFGNKDYKLAFVLLSSTLLINQLSAGQLVILQGLRKISSLAKANLWGSFVGLLFTIPLYYLWGTKGIVPGIIIASVTKLIFSWLYEKKLHIKLQCLASLKDILNLGSEMLWLGVALSLNGMLTSLAAYILRVFIKRYGNIEEVGLYTAGFTIIGAYVGLIFTAMTTDYFPKLSAIAREKRRVNILVNQQLEIAVLILAPILLFFVVFIKQIISILYSSDFLSIVPMMRWAACGIFLKAISSTIAYLFVAKGNGKLFFFNELVANIYFLTLNMLFYKYIGLDGLGISFLVGYILYFLQVTIVSIYKYAIVFTFELMKVFLLQLVLLTITLTIALSIAEKEVYLYGGGSIVISVYFSIVELRKRTNLNAIFKKR